MSAGFVTLADLQRQLGGIPLERIRAVPAPGSATEKDALFIQDQEGRTCEVIDGVLVEKAMGYYESRIAILIGYFLETFLANNDLGIVLGADGLLKIASQIRAPDVSFIAWAKFPDRCLPEEPVPHLVPDLTVEVLSASNTKSEIKMKFDEYFAAGVRTAWIVDPSRESAQIHSSRDNFELITESGVLRASVVLPGFELPLRELFDRAGKGSRR